MIVFNAHISEKTFHKILDLKQYGFEACNDALFNLTGIVRFFETVEDFEIFDSKTLVTLATRDNERIEYGDFQTNAVLSQKVCALLREEGIAPKIVLEPTFGQGNFILSALKTFDSIEQIIGVEIYKPYIWDTKFSILEHFLEKTSDKKPIITLYHQSVFDFDFSKIDLENKELLILGNPPWVTNTTLSTLGSGNLPRKSNFKNHSGLDAMTGKGNFDIAESITLMLIQAFHLNKGNIAFLVKNAVIKNIIQEQKQNKYNLSNIQKQVIDTQKEFDVSVDAALLISEFGGKQDEFCTEMDFYTQKVIKTFGWSHNKFVANIDKYFPNKAIDGRSHFEWRQGVKHDCAKVMELENCNTYFKNGLDDTLHLEEDLVFGILKSSDLKHKKVDTSRKYTIITQKKVGQDTHYIKDYFPKTWAYLMDKKRHFDNRKSSIYVGKPPFSIFGIGDYSFAPYKVAISGLYKTGHFTLVLPQNSKPLMLDDTCYFIGFDNLQDAMITQAILNAQQVQDFLQSIIFWDSKRAITKDILCRINIAEVAETMSFDTVHEMNNNISFEYWEKYKQLFKVSNQLSIF